MIRSIDWKCRCGHEILDCMAREEEKKKCPQCGKAMEQAWWGTTKHDAEWSDKDAVVVFRDAQGKIRYPGRNDVPTPAGYERVTMRSLRAVERFEKAQNVHSEMAWFDRGSGRAHDDTFRGEKYS